MVDKLYPEDRYPRPLTAACTDPSLPVPALLEHTTVTDSDDSAGDKTVRIVKMFYCDPLCDFLFNLFEAAQKKKDYQKALSIKSS